MRSPALGRLLGLAALQPLLASSADPTDVLGLFQSNVRLSPEALHFVETMPAAVNLEHVDHSGLAAKFLSILQGTRFHRSFMFFNNLSAATADLYSHTQGELSRLKTGLKRADNKQALELVVKFFAQEREVVHQFSNVTESKLNAYLADLTEEDNSWLRPIATSVVRHMTQLLAPVHEKAKVLDSLTDGPSICSTVQLILNDLQSMDEVIREHEIPAFNKTSSLIPALETTSSKGRLKMLKRFADQGYTILEKVRSVIAMPNGTFAPLLAERLPCSVGASAPAEVVLHSEGSAPALAADQAEPTREPAAAAVEAKTEEKRVAQEEPKKAEPKEEAKKEEEPKEVQKEAEQQQKEQREEEQRKALQRTEEERKAEEERKEQQRQEKLRQEEEKQEKQERRKEEQKKSAEDMREWQRREEQLMEERKAEAVAKIQKFEQRAQEAEEAKRAELEKVVRQVKELREATLKLETERREVQRRARAVATREQEQKLRQQKWEESRKAEAQLHVQPAQSLPKPIPETALVRPSSEEAEGETTEHFEPQYDTMQAARSLHKVIKRAQDKARAAEDRSAAFALAPGTLAALVLLGLLHA